MKRAFGYIRVSKDPKLEKLSPAVQRRMLREACSARRWELSEIFEDIDVSSAKMDAAGTWAELATKLKPGDVVVTWEFTRIGRNLRQTLERIDRLHEQGVELVSLEGDLDTTTAAGKLQYQVLLVLAEFERNRLGERLRHTHEQIAREGRWKGGGTPPLGYKYTPGAKVLEVEPEEAEIVRELYRLRDAGASIHTLIREMDARGVKGKRGARLDYSAISQTLRNPTYIGKRVHKGDIHDGQQEPIVELEVWERVQARRRTGQPNSGSYLLSGFLRCGVCKSTMIHQRNRARSLYACKRARQFRDTTLITIEEHLADEWVTEALFKRLDGKKLGELKEKARRKAPKAKAKTGQVQAQLARVEASLERLVSDYYDADQPLLTPEQFRKKNAELLESKASLEGKLRELKDVAQLNNIVNLSERRARDIRESWEGMTLDERREVLRLFVESVTVAPAKKKFDRGRVRINWR
jgi:site-specific DNA recombinase